MATAFTTTTINMTSWRARAQEVMALGSDIILVQETRLGEEGLRGARALAARAGYRAFLTASPDRGEPGTVHAGSAS